MHIYILVLLLISYETCIFTLRGLLDCVPGRKYRLIDSVKNVINYFYCLQTKLDVVHRLFIAITGVYSNHGHVIPFILISFIYIYGIAGNHYFVNAIYS